ncbi:MAG: beta-N-acetylhexosaminidase [Solirubrobacteraceae bacterium]|nr:beta-N-acetylhexosaminidase [Solirubrobacteraceae bacterium]
MTVARRPLAVAAVLLLAVTAAGSAGAATGGTGPGATQPGPALPALSTRQLVGQHMVLSYAGPTPPAALERRIRAGEVAGVILFARNIASRGGLRATIARLQAIPRPAGLGAPLLVMIDQEGGLVKRLSGAPSRSPAAVGRTGSIAVARAEGTATARNLRGVGVNVNLAPVLDTARPGSFSEQLGRSYSRDPARVAALGSAFAGALRAGSVAATAKHFPGIGVPRVDEDAVASRIGLSQATLRRIDEAPFAAAIRGRIDLVMLATAIYPAFDRLPALFSRRLATDELRGRLGFTGVSITDDLETAAASQYGSPATQARMSTRAGADLLLFAQSYARGAQAAEGLIRDTRAGRVSTPELRSSAARILALRASLR